MSTKFYVTAGNSVKVSGKYYQEDQEVLIAEKDAKPLVKSGVLTTSSPKEQAEEQADEEAENQKSAATIKDAKETAAEIVEEATQKAAEIVNAAKEEAAEIIKAATEGDEGGNDDKFVNPFLEIEIEDKHAKLLIAAGYSDMDKLGEASLEALEVIQGISKKLAKEIVDCFVEE